jgi:hypothetical protein
MSWGIKTHNINRTLAMLSGKKKSYADAFSALIKELRPQVRMKSPVKTRNFYRSWDIAHTGKYSAYFRNYTDYSEAVVEGCPVGQKPWPSAGPLTSEIGGRVWSNKMLENPPNVGTYMQTVFDEDRIVNRFKTLAAQLEKT